MSDARVTPIVDVLLRAQVPDADLAELRRHLATIGMAPRARVRTMPVRRDPRRARLDDPVGGGGGGAERLRRRRRHPARPGRLPGLSELVRRVANRDAHRAGHSHRTLIVARDRDSWVEAVLDPDLPAEALAQLRDLAVADGERVRWDGRRRRWRRHADLPPR